MVCPPWIPLGFLEVFIMKKLLLFLLVLIFITAAIFAQVGLNKRIVVGTSFINGDTLKEEGSQEGIEASIQRLEYSISIGGKTEDGTFGFGGEFEKRHNLGRIFGWAWWQPVPEITIALGEVTNWQVPLGRASGDISGWGLLGDDAFHMDDDAFWEGGGYAGSVLKTMHGFYQGVAYSTIGWDEASFSGAISIRPLSWFGISSADKLNILFYFPTLAVDPNSSFGNTVKSVYLDRLEIQVAYDFSGIGQAAVSFRNSMREAGMIIQIPNVDPSLNYLNYDIHHWYDDSKGIYAQWRMGLPHKMAFEAGVQYTIAPANNVIKVKWPINAGLGWIMGDRSEEPLVFSSRLGMQIPVEDFQNFILGWDGAVNIGITGSTRLYLPVSLGFIFPSNGPAGEKIIAGKGDNAVVYWAFSPYVVQDLKGPKVHMCFRIHNGQGTGWPQIGPNAPHNGEIMGSLSEFQKRGKIITWSVPIYLVWSF